MIRQISQLNDTQTHNHREIEILRQHFPQCFTNEGAFDIDLFKIQIEEKINFIHEGYDLNFLGKNYAKLLSSIDTTTVIVPDEVHNNLPENANSQNVYISGDNLDGLKHLLKSYAGAVKCIYIDPPYNTGTDGFVYNDRFDFSIEDLSVKLSISEEQAAKILDLTRRGSASHSAWLTFMACRLQLARDLLTHDGVIFISIDDNEQANLKLLCDSVFGEENFVANLKWKRKKQPSFLSTHVANVMEYVLIYSKDKNSLEKLSIEGTSDFTKKVVNISNNESVRHFKKNVRIKIEGSGVIPAGRYKIRTMEVEYIQDVNYSKGYTLNKVDVKSKFSVSQQKIDDYIDNDLLYITAQKGLRRDVSKEEIGKRKSIIDLLHSGWGDNQESDKEFINLFGEKYFDYTKPVDLIKNIILSNYTENCTVLDFFSGSATTAEAVMRANHDDGNRNYILIQLPENLYDNYENATGDNKEKISKAIDFLKSLNYPPTLNYIGIERIKRAAAVIKKESDANNDYGFKHYTLQEPDNNTLDKLEVFNPDKIFADETVLDSFGKSTVLETWLVRDGYGFGAYVKPIQLKNYTIYHIDKHIYFIDVGFNEKDMVELIDLYSEEASFGPENIIIFGYSFTFTETEMLKKNLGILRDGDKSLNVNIDIRY